MPGATIRKASAKRLELRARAAFRVCQAISIAITVVLPAPVASLKAMRNRSGFASAFSVRSRSDSCFGATSASHIGGLHRLDLAEEQAAPSVGAAPVAQQPGSYRCNCGAESGIAQRACGYPGTDLVDVVVGFPLPILVFKPRASWAGTLCRGGGTGTTNSLRRRPVAGTPVGMPFSSSSQWQAGSAKALLRMGLSMTGTGT